MLGSGSSGNALLVESSGTRVLVDAGVGPRLLAARLELLGLELGPGDLHAIIATHHHGDHFSEVGRLARMFDAPVYVHAGIDEDRLAQALATSERAPKTRPVELREYKIGQTFRVGELTIENVIVPHDAPHVAVRVDDGAAAIGVATDVGRPTNELIALLAACDAALVEANHCAEMLAYGEYPERLKKRVGGGLGHLSNVQTADLAQKLAGTRLGRMWLGHLSRENNTPERALEVVQGAAKRLDVEVLPHGAVCALDVKQTRPYQLALF